MSEAVAVDWSNDFPGTTKAMLSSIKPGLSECRVCGKPVKEMTSPDGERWIDAKSIGDVYPG